MSFVVVCLLMSRYSEGVRQYHAHSEKSIYGSRFLIVEHLKLRCWCRRPQGKMSFACIKEVAELTLKDAEVKRTVGKIDIG
jgi:hypothetical protein